MATLIFKSGTPHTGTTIHGFKVQTDFSTTYESPGVTKVSWVFKTIYEENSRYPATSEKAFASISLSFSSSDGSVISNITGSSYKSGSTVSGYPTYKTSVTLGSGSLLVTHTSTGAAQLSISSNVSIGGYDCDKSTTFTLDTNLPYTACKAPSTIEASGIVAPSSDFTVTWKEAEGGHENPISGYKVYYKISKEGTYPTESSYTGVKTVASTESSCTFSSTSKTRGYIITFGIVVLGNSNISSEGFNPNSELKTGGKITVNQLPSAPTVKINGVTTTSTVIPSTGGSVSFQITCGTDKDTTQTLKTRYRIKKNGESSYGKETSLASSVISTTLSFSDSATVQFETWDGLESSSKVEIQVVKNIKPTFNLKLSGPSLNSINKINSIYCINPTCSVINIKGGQSKKEYTYVLKAENDSTGIYCDLGKYSVSSYEIKDIRKEIGNIFYNNGAEYWFEVTCNDGIETTTVISEKYSVTKIPELKFLYNKYNEDANVAGFYEGNYATFYSKVLTYLFDYDEGYNSVHISNDGTNYNLTSLSQMGNNLKGRYIFENTKTPKVQEISFKLGNTSTEFYTNPVNRRAITQIGTIEFYNIQFDSNQSEINYYDSIYPKISCGGIPECFFANFNKSECKNYGVIGTKEEIQQKFYLTFLTNSSNILFPLIESIGTNNTSTFFQINKTQSDISFLNKETTHSGDFYLFLQNDFGDPPEPPKNTQVTGGQSSITKGTFNFIKAPEIEYFEIYALHENEKINYNDMPFILGGQIFHFSSSIKFYNTTNQKVKIQYSINQGAWLDLAVFEPQKLPLEKWVVDDLNKKTFNIPNNTNGDEQILIRILAISNDNNISNTIPSLKSFRRFDSPVLQIYSSSYQPSALENEEGILTLNFSFKDTGVSQTSIDNQIVTLVSFFWLDEMGIVNSRKTIISAENSKLLKGTSQTISFPFSFEEGNESAKICFGAKINIKCEAPNAEGQMVEISSFFKESEYGLTTLYTVYNLVPTVAYRKNSLGVNVFDPESNDIITIGDTQQRNAITFKGSSNSYCKVINFHIDGGTWG